MKYSERYLLTTKTLTQVASGPQTTQHLTCVHLLLCLPLGRCLSLGKGDSWAGGVGRSSGISQVVNVQAHKETREGTCRDPAWGLWLPASLAASPASTWTLTCRLGIFPLSPGTGQSGKGHGPGRGGHTGEKVSLGVG